MRIPISLALAIVVAGMPLAGTYAQTRRPTAQEVAAIRNCATQYQDDVDEGERQCLFNLVATPCTKTREGSSNLGTADCYRVEWVIWDNLLNENFKNLMGALDNQRIAKLRAMQQAWIAYRDTTCNFYMEKIQGLRGARNRPPGAAASVFRSDLGHILHKTELFNPAAGRIPQPH
jgi:Lysozyme inhibitor LprI